VAAVVGVIAAGAGAVALVVPDDSGSAIGSAAAKAFAEPGATAGPGSSGVPSPGASVSGSPQAARSCGALAFDKPSISALRSSAKKAFAYYFPPFPVSIDNKASSSDSYSKWLFAGDATGQYDLRDRPLPRAPRSGSWRQKDFETEVRQAIAIGLDGFIWEYHTSSDQRWNQLPAMLAAVKAVDPGFTIMLSPDLPQGADTAPDGIVNDVLKVKDEPALFRRNGSVVLAPFYPERKPPAFWDGVRATLKGRGVDTVLVPLFLDGSPSTRNAQWNAGVAGYSLWGAAWASTAEGLRKAAGQAHAQGRIYMTSTVFEDSRSYSGQFWEAGNSDTLRATLKSAIDGNADWLYFRTWNDYTESWMAPSRERGTSVGDVAAYYITWFKTGRAPTLKRDALYYFHRSQHTDLTPTGAQRVRMKLTAGAPLSNDVELLAFLAAPGQLVIRQGSDVRTKEGVGLVSFKVPVKPGTTPVFELHRAGATVQTVKSATPIRTSVPLQDWVYHGGGGTACR
jgi:hypothetical protein